MNQQIEQLRAIRSAAEKKLRLSPEFLIVQSLSRLIKDLETIQSKVNAVSNNEEQAAAPVQEGNSFTPSAKPISIAPDMKIKTEDSAQQAAGKQYSAPESNISIEKKEYQQSTAISNQRVSDFKTQKQHQENSTPSDVEQDEEESLDEMLIRIANTLRAS